MNGHCLNRIIEFTLTRGLFPADALPERGDDLFDTFAWVKQVYSIPSACLVFTDGSLLDNKLPKDCHALGWSFSVFTADGEHVAQPKGCLLNGMTPSRELSCGPF